MAQVYRVAANVHTTDPETLTKAAEVLSRTAAGLLLEGIDVFFTMTLEDENDDGTI